MNLMDLFSGEGFPPRWQCGPTWEVEPWWGWMHIVGDVSIWAAYFAIPIVLLRIVGVKNSWPFRSILLLFASFILLCGLTHLIDAIIFYWPIYRLNAILKVLTGSVSVATVVTLILVLPRILMMRGVGEIELDLRNATKELGDVSQQLRVNRNVLEVALDFANAGVFQWDVQTDRIRLDAGSMRLTGMRNGEFGIESKVYVEKIVRFQDEFVAAIQRSIDSKQPFAIRYQFHNPSTGNIWLSCEGRPLVDSAGQVISLIGVQKNVSEQVKFEVEMDQSIQTERLNSAQKSRFIAQVSHEIRTPLTAMLGLLDSVLLAKESAETNVELVNTLEVVRSQGEVLKILVNDVLDLAKIEQGKIELRPNATSVEKLFAQTHQLMLPLASEKNLEFTTSVGSDVPSLIMCDPDRVRQVLVNLVGNSIKFTTSGQVRLEAFACQSAGIDSVGFRVSDTGSGIAQERISDVFKEYEQASDVAGGTGLGLAICKHLVNLMAGEISIESKVSHGTTIEFWIPASIGDLEGLAQGTRRNLPRKDQNFDLRVLVAEDTRALQLMVRRMLDNKVRQLDLVDDGQQAVDAFQATQSEGPEQAYDLIILDIQMPIMDGKSAARRLRSLGYRGKLVAFSAGVLLSEQDECFEAGFDLFLGKPLSMDEMVEVLALVQTH